MVGKVIPGQVVGSAGTRPDAIDGAVEALVQRSESKYRWRAKAWAFVSIVLLVLWSLQRLEWEWIVAAVAGLFSLINFVGLLVAGAEFMRAEARKRLVARSEYLRAGGR